MLQEDFLKAVFDRIVPTSTYVERMFARFNKWVDTKGHKLYLSQLAAKHFTNAFTSMVETWREKEQSRGRLQRQRSSKFRPLWVKGGRQQQAQTGLHLFAKGFLAHNPNRGGGHETWDCKMRRASRAWSVLSADERRHWKRVAKAANRERQAEPQPAQETVGGPRVFL